MSAFRTALDFFKTWFLPMPAHDDDGQTAGKPLHSARAKLQESPTAAPAPTPPALEEQRDDYPGYAVPPVPTALQETAGQTVNPFTADAADANTDEAESRGDLSPIEQTDFSESDSGSPTNENEDYTTEPAKPAAAPSESPDFSHMVKPPEAANMRYSRRRMEGSDPSAE